MTYYQSAWESRICYAPIDQEPRRRRRQVRNAQGEAHPSAWESRTVYTPIGPERGRPLDVTSLLLILVLISVPLFFIGPSGLMILCCLVVPLGIAIAAGVSE